MKLKLSFACAFVVLAFALAFLFFAVGDSNHAAWAFIIVTAVLNAIATIVNSFALLYLLKLKTMNRYESPRPDPDIVIGIIPTADPCARKPAA